jgi:chromosome segregation protein
VAVSIIIGDLNLLSRRMRADFVAAYVDALKKAKIGLGIITNHNKFNIDEFKALRKRARKEGVGL